MVNDTTRFLCRVEIWQARAQHACSTKKSQLNIQHDAILFLLYTGYREWFKHHNSNPFERQRSSFKARNRGECQVR